MIQTTWNEQRLKDYLHSLDDETDEELQEKRRLKKEAEQKMIIQEFIKSIEPK